ncbi:TonB-dependent receptor plug domain-containing protein [Pelagicoccus sp. SDUM812003]|uniref:TonB-dependent receptor plug domain-containing protein n=1 Tax=Pelagicoccus sp. SDUM812003 TaxID=3041267 RepID=UPI00280E4D36|nr:TonB-dependent receptor plug domain-containing protein [Pelagicoccus sp. SDUM812003]MDQ8203228.1 TonB-dependent receptor plug domain-containing protein [Pelagicoccus sp. SDUM812003]
MNRKNTPNYPRFRTALALALLLQAGSTGFAQEEDDEEIFELSPFEVTSSDDDIGYHSENTLMGTRLNSNIGDLAASITLVTKQQMEDTAAVDINDVFLYEANTEGAHNYTAYHVNRGYLKDEAAGISQDNGTVYSHATSNRIRGLGAADTSLNNYPTISRVPFDTYNTNSVEINRGPNSMLFGMGSPAGIVNQTTASAIIGQESSEISARVDSFGGWRASASHNQTIIEDKLAVFVAALHDERGFERKPSYDKTDRQYLAFRFQPAENTTFRASFENYENESRRPNTIAPRDTITPWLQSGRPVWDSRRKMMVYLDSGKEVGPYLFNRDGWDSETGPYAGYSDANVTNPDGAYYYGDNDLWRTDSALFIGTIGPMSGTATIHVQPDGTYSARETNLWRDRPAPADVAEANLDAYWNTRETRMMQTIVPWTDEFYPGASTMNPFYPTGLINPDVYDWSEVNITAPNFQSLDNKTYNFEFEQKLAENLYFSAGWFRQDADSLENNPISNTSPTTVSLDVNMYLPDGSENPNYLKPFIDDYRADAFTHPEENETLRAQIAYQFDFTDSDNWTKWLGQHQLMGLYSDNERNRYGTRSRIAYFDEPNGGYHYAHSPERRAEINANYSLGADNSAIRRYYYIGENAKVTQGNSGIGAAGSLENWGTGGPTDFNFDTFFWESDTGGTWRDVPVEIGTALWWPSTSRSQIEVESTSAALQSRFWESRIVTTLGFREDKYVGNSYWGGREEPGYENGLPIGGTDYYFNNNTGTEELSGSTSTRGIVFKVTENISLTYNESDNFNPPNGNSTDFYGNPLPKPTGEGKDYGIRFKLLENKLHASFNWFETTSANARGVPGVFVDRTNRIDYKFMFAWAENVVRIRDGQDPTSEDWRDGDIYPLTDDQRARIWDIIGLEEDYFDNINVQGTQDTEAKGFEFQMVYNPIPNWTMKLSGGKQNTSFNNVAPQWEPWASAREAVWANATATDMAESYTLFNGEELKIRNFWTGTNYISELDPASNNGWFTTADYYRLTVTNEIATIRNKEGQIVPGQREWRANFLTNYKFTDGKLKGFGIGGSARWEEAAAIGNYGIVEEDGVMRQPDISRPIYGDSEFHVDFWASYEMPIGEDKNLKLQLNVRDALEDGGLQKVAANFDGSVYGYRYLDPRQIFLTTTLEF